MLHSKNRTHRFLFLWIIPIALALACGSTSTTPAVPKSTEGQISSETLSTRSPTNTLPPEPTKTSIPTSTPTVTPTAGPVAEFLLERNANIRGGPSTDYPVITGAQAGDILQVWAKNDDGTWLLIDPDNYLWIYITLGTLSSPIDTIPLASAFASSSPEPTATITEFALVLPTRGSMPSSTPNASALIDVPSLLGQTTAGVEAILGAPILITPNNDYDDNLAGGEYRDYQVGDYYFMIGYDSQGIARIFQVLDGLDAQNYTLSQWKIIFPIFGLGTNNGPDRELTSVYYWDYYEGLAIALAASSNTGRPVWTILIEQSQYSSH